MIKIYYSEKTDKIVMYNERSMLFAADDISGLILPILFELIVVAANLKYIGEL